jgi:hypothetical protein
MWKQRLLTSTKLRTVNQGLYGRTLGQAFFANARATFKILSAAEMN